MENKKKTQNYVWGIKELIENGKNTNKLLQIYKSYI